MLSGKLCDTGKILNAPKWWQECIVYQIYPSSFKDTNGDGYGDLRGIIDKLDYISSLGVGAVWITPVYASPMGDNGYDVADYYSINPLYGTMEDMDELLAEAGKRGIRIVMDLVFNHTSDEHAWFKESKSSRDNAKSDWYIWRDGVIGEDGERKAPNNWRSIFGGPAWEWCPEREQYYLHTFGVFQPDVDWENPEVRQALYDVTRYWINKGVGGFRVDAISYIKKPKDYAGSEPDGIDGLASIHLAIVNTDGILDLLHDFRREVAEGTDIFMVGEANGVAAEELPLWVGDNGVFDMIFSFDLASIHFDPDEVWSRRRYYTIHEIRQAFDGIQKNTADTWTSVFLENHDQPRAVDHFIIPALNNAARERRTYTIDELTNERGLEPEAYKKAAKAMAAILFTMRGTPFLYQGEELGMTNVSFPVIDMYNDLATFNQYDVLQKNGFSAEAALKCVHRLSRDNTRTPMQWDTSENAGFTTGEPWLSVNPNYTDINVAAEEQDENSVLAWHKRLAVLRKEHYVFINGDYALIPELCDSDEIFAYARDNGREKAIVLVNFTEQEVSFDVSIVDGMKAIASNYETDDKKAAASGCAEMHEAGKLKAFEAVIYVS